MEIQKKVHWTAEKDNEMQEKFKWPLYRIPSPEGYSGWWGATAPPPQDFFEQMGKKWVKILQICKIRLIFQNVGLFVAWVGGGETNLVGGI